MTFSEPFVDNHLKSVIAIEQHGPSVLRSMKLEGECWAVPNMLILIFVASVSSLIFLANVPRSGQEARCGFPTMFLSLSFELLETWTLRSLTKLHLASQPQSRDLDVVFHSQCSQLRMNTTLRHGAIGFTEGHVT